MYVGMAGQTGRKISIQLKEKVGQTVIFPSMVPSTALAAIMKLPLPMQMC